jgi:hypothetical protein
MQDMNTVWRAPNCRTKRYILKAAYAIWVAMCYVHGDGVDKLELSRGWLRYLRRGGGEGGGGRGGGLIWQLPTKCPSSCEREQEGNMGRQKSERRGGQEGVRVCEGM